MSAKTETETGRESRRAGYLEKYREYKCLLHEQTIRISCSIRCDDSDATTLSFIRIVIEDMQLHGGGYARRFRFIT